MRIKFCIALLLLGVCLTGQPARAEPMWFHYWLVDVGQLPTTTSGINLIQQQPEVVDGDSAEMIALQLQAYASLPSTPEELINATYELTLKLTDNASGQDGQLSFKGTLNGTISSSEIDIKNVFDKTTDSVLLGSKFYTVELTSFTPPKPGLSDTDLGEIKARITLNDVITFTNAPEPGALWLLGFSLPLIAAVRRRLLLSRGTA